jgi:intracellular sulfur oxidation DsrE/DsrF family protein
MRIRASVIGLNLLFSVCFLCLLISNAYSGQPEALKGVKSIKAVFDVRTGDSNVTASVLNLVHSTFHDSNITTVAKKPDFVVVFSGPVAKLISTNRAAFSLEEQNILKKLADRISQMSKDGIRLEVCDLAVTAFGVDASSILPEIKHISNGWISLIGYQSKGFAIVSAY